MKKQIVVSGMQPSGQLHIGNYLGALKNWVDIQNSGKYDCFFFVADYHSITENYNPEDKRQQIFNLVVDYLAAGLDPEKVTIFIQSQVPQCTELAWIFNTVTPVAELERMTQFKDKSGRQLKNINMGLFDYPILQAADILLYRGELIPVGEDQIQHVELTRDVARWFNNKYKTNFFPEAKPLLTPTARVMSLADPDKKMSKSLGEKHWLGIDESAEVILDKIKKAVTTDKGIENLRGIYQAFETNMPGEFNPERMGETKAIIAAGVYDYFTDFRQQKEKLLKNSKYVDKVLKDGQKKAEKIAAKSIGEIKEIIGLQ
ncbi:tryptophan--tRNA ligase [Candidatus Falkowbacteria bacterium]|uniref:Tryptophan--tRNA ligase n=1 Tax=Candidatus Buchananbacteria bacterium CG10_big_fil_rev_8_21_14_0_10_33_19 TaxID=1974525 RepID=A0A2H0W4U2_9BACT|nr:tryptophan--tRNA ligase [Candidatus Falkowbacteria bacterium]PIS06297.1 MAG: tryptophan--tRNA ligase [Candidatus Buchananbacteria bacterium CG10_big_fil_rev_8_21_14_0_10_33_19]